MQAAPAPSCSSEGDAFHLQQLDTDAHTVSNVGLLQMCRRSSWSATSAALEVATFCLQLADAPDCCCSKRSELALL